MSPPMGQADIDTPTSDATESPQPALDRTPMARACLAARLDLANSWLRGHRSLTLIALLLVASFLRLVTWSELAETPCFNNYQASQMDMLFFHRWAKAIDDKSLLSDFADPELRHPLHEWHWHVAKDYLNRHPEETAGEVFDQQPIETKQAEVLQLWGRWYQGKRFHQEPLYPYLLAGVYALVGENPQEPGPFPNVPRGILAVYILQVLSGILSVGLIYLLSRRYFGDLVAVLAAALTIGYAPLLYYEFILLRVTWICTAGLLLVFLAERLRERQTGARWLGFGLMTGLLVMLKTTLLLFSAGAAALILWPERKRGRQAIAKLGLMAAGGLIALSPVIVRNLSVGASALSITSVGPVTFAASNYEGYLPSEGWNPDPKKVSAIMDKSKGSLSAAIPATIATHRDVFAYGKLLLGKFLQVWHWFEIPNNAKFYLFQLYSKVLQWLPTPFWLTAPFGLYGLGLVLSKRREERRRSALLILLIATAILPMVAFYVLSRFRVPMVLAMSPFAAYGMITLLRENRRRHLLWTGLALLLCMLAINRQIEVRPNQPKRESVNYWDLRDHMTSFWGPRIQRAEQDGDYALAAKLLNRFLDTMPPRVRAVSPQEPPEDVSLARITKDYGTGFLHSAMLLEKAGLEVRAARTRRRGEELLKAAKIAWDRLVTARPERKVKLELPYKLSEKLRSQFRSGFKIQVVLDPFDQQADFIAALDANGILQPILFEDHPQGPPKRGAPLLTGTTKVLIIGSEVRSILLMKNNKKVGLKSLPAGLTRGNTNTIRIRL